MHFDLVCVKEESEKQQRKQLSW